VQVQPFEVIHYPFEAELLRKVVCPPYDKFTNDQITAFRRLDGRNFVWAILGETLEDHRYYQEAAERLRNWTRDGLLRKESEKGFLVYRQRYTSPLTGTELTRSGFMGLLSLPERSEKAVLPHERTFSEHKKDRLSLYRAVRGTPEAIFVLYSDPEGKTTSLLRETPATVAFEDFNGHSNELALLASPAAIAAIRAVVEPQRLLMADGHHRFETGQDYRDECRQADPGARGPQPYDFILVYFTPLEDSGLVVLPTHRPVKGVAAENIRSFIERASDFFEVEDSQRPVDPRNLQESALQVHENYPDRETFGLVTQDRILFLHLRDREKLKSLLPPSVGLPLRDLPVVWLHSILLERFLEIGQEEGAPDRVAYVRTGEDVYNALHQGGYDVAFLLRGTRPEEVQKVAESGERMPQKSTDFFPKILSGLAVYLHP